MFIDVDLRGKIEKNYEEMIIIKVKRVVILGRKVCGEESG